MTKRMSLSPQAVTRLERHTVQDEDHKGPEPEGGSIEEQGFGYKRLQIRR